MTAAIKRMLAERALLEKKSEAGRGWENLVTDLFEMIDAAAPFMDEHLKAGSWPPSVLLKIAYLSVATGPTANKQKVRAAFTFVSDMLERSRQMMTAGYVANPFDAEPRLRSDVMPS